MTGGAQGFGLSISEKFINSGAKVIIWDIDKNAGEKAMNKANSKIALIKLSM